MKKILFLGSIFMIMGCAQATKSNIESGGCYDTEKFFAYYECEPHKVIGVACRMYKAGESDFDIASYPNKHNLRVFIDDYSFLDIYSYSYCGSFRVNANEGIQTWNAVSGQLKSFIEETSDTTANIIIELSNLEFIKEQGQVFKMKRFKSDTTKMFIY